LALQTARDVGAPGVDDVTGRGHVDLVRAFQPVGTVAAPLADGRQIAFGTPLGAAGPAMGDAFARAGALQTVGFDAFGRTFDLALGGAVRPAALAFAPMASPLLWRSDVAGLGRSQVQFALTEPQVPGARIEGLSPDDPDVVFRSSALLPGGLDVQVGFRTPLTEDLTGGAFTGFMGLAQERGVGLRKRFGERVSLGFIAQTGEAPSGAPFQTLNRRLFAGRLSVREGPVQVGVTAGRLGEEGGALGLSWNPAAGAPGAAGTGFVALDGDARLPASLRLLARLELGRTQAAEAGLFEGGSLTASAASAMLRWEAAPAPWGLRGALVLSAAQPLRVESGGFRWQAATATAFGVQSLGFEEQFVRADPSGRQIETRLAYELFGGGRFTARAEVARIADPGHVEAAPPAYAAGAGVRLAF